jgi:hypothetical protein
MRFSLRTLSCVVLFVAAVIGLILAGERLRVQQSALSEADLKLTDLSQKLAASLNRETQLSATAAQTAQDLDLLRLRTIGHSIPIHAEIGNSQATALPEHITAFASDLQAFSCSGVMGTARSRKLRRFAQWLLQLNTKKLTLCVNGKQVYDDEGAHIVFNRATTLITAEICQIARPDQRKQNSERQFGVWISVGNYPDALRFVLPLEPLAAEGSYTIEDCILKDRDVGTEEIAVFKVLKHKSNNVEDPDIVTTPIEVTLVHK